MTIDFFYLSSFLGPTSPGAQPLSSVLYTLLKPPNTRPGIPDASPDTHVPRSQNTRHTPESCGNSSSENRGCIETVQTLSGDSNALLPRRGHEDLLQEGPSSSWRDPLRRGWHEDRLALLLPARMARHASKGTSENKPRVLTERERESRGCKVWGARCVRGRGAHRDTTTPKITTTRRNIAPMTTMIAMAHVGILSSFASDRFASC